MASQEKQQIYEQTRSVYHAQHQRITVFCAIIGYKP